MTLKATLSSNNKETILTESLRGKYASLREYKGLMNEARFPSRLIDLLKEQRNSIETAINSANLYEDAVS